MNLILQHTIVLIIVSGAVIVSFYNLYKLVINSRKKAASGCSGACSSCSLKSELLKQ